MIASDDVYENSARAPAVVDFYQSLIQCKTLLMSLSNDNLFHDFRLSKIESFALLKLRPSTSLTLSYADRRDLGLPIYFQRYQLSLSNLYVE